MTEKYYDKLKEIKNLENDLEADEKALALSIGKNIELAESIKNRYGIVYNIKLMLCQEHKATFEAIERDLQLLTL